MGQDVTDADGTPRRALFSYRAQERVIPELLGVVKGIICDGVLSDADLVALKQWIASHPDACLRWPGSVLAPRLVAAFEDGFIDDEEREDLRHLLQDCVGEADDQAGLLSRSTQLPLDRPFPQIVFANREFCFTGVFAYGIRRRCEEEVIKRGGRRGDAVTSRTQYLVIGIDASQAWVGSTHGRKIEQAMLLRDERGQGLSIISEEHWVGALGQ